MRTNLIKVLLLSFLCLNGLMASAQKKPRNEVIIVNGVRFTMVYVEGGTFQMGNDSFVRERPRHTVQVDDFYMGETEVTQALWMAVMGNNPSKNKSMLNPVEYVSYEQVLQFIERLKELTDRSFRLPTEAEWEYAARGGQKSRGYKYSGNRTLGHVAWYRDNANQTTHPVKSKLPNELGIYDMCGNVWEMCQDWYEANYYESSPTENPQGPDTGTERAIRGGAWGVDADYCRITYRTFVEPTTDNISNLGFRLVLIP